VAANISGAGVDWLGPSEALTDNDTGASVVLSSGQSSDWLSLSGFSGDTISNTVASAELLTEIRSGAPGNVAWETLLLTDGTQIASASGTEAIGAVYAIHALDLLGVDSVTATQLNDPLLEVRLRFTYAGQSGPFLVDVITVSVDVEKGIGGAPYFRFRYGLGSKHRSRG